MRSKIQHDGKPYGYCCHLRPEDVNVIPVEVEETHKISEPVSEPFGDQRFNEINIIMFGCAMFRTFLGFRSCST